MKKRLRYLFKPCLTGYLWRNRVSLGVPMAGVEIIDVPKSLINENPALCIEIGGWSVQCTAGLQLGSRYVADLGRDLVLEHLPQ